jgi:DNA-binding IclR family transcriptional regulator
MSRATFYRALSDLLESGWLYNTGPDKHPFWVIDNEE